MKVSEHWLRQWVNPKFDTKHLAEQLTLAGLEVESVTPCEAEFKRVVVAEVLDIAPHPEADKLKICSVKDGKSTLQIVCGAPNVRAGMRVPLARPGAELPNNLTIKPTRLRGVESQGMLCSGKELGLSDDAGGLMVLPMDAPVGKALATYLDLPDTVFDIKLTPNRGDCLSVAGLAREIAALNRLRVSGPPIPTVRPRSQRRIPVKLKAGNGCPLYTGRVMTGLKMECISPVWLTERLRRAGLRPIHPVVDVTNYVMLELGQPLHAFDLRQLQGSIMVRWARDGEWLTLLDGQRVKLSADMLVIADRNGPKALGGVMGGENSGVVSDTTDIFIESAFFTPQAVAGRARRLGVTSEAAHRFERGVDPELPRKALERATALLQTIAGGHPGPVTQARAAHQRSTKTHPITLRRERLSGLLGVSVPDREVTSILRRLNLQPKTVAQGWRVKPPSYRFDITLEEDLVEEVGRLHGFNRIPELPLIAPIRPGQALEQMLDPERLRLCLTQRGYSEVITYSFVPLALDALLGGTGTPAALQNPLSAELAQMRRSLWPGLVQTLSYNLRRQQERIRIFELGRRYYLQDIDIKEVNTVAGLAYGRVEPEQWGIPKHEVDFADLKGDVMALFAPSHGIPRFIPTPHPGLHPGQSAAIFLGKQRVGWIGALHPSAVRALDLPEPPLLFEVDQDAISCVKVPVFKPVSRYPSVRRDIAVVVPEAVTAAELKACVLEDASQLLQEVIIFDIYKGSGVDSGRKSVALGLILQDSSRTLTDEAADTMVSRIIQRLQRKLGATIRD